MSEINGSYNQDYNDVVRRMEMYGNMHLNAAQGIASDEMNPAATVVDQFAPDTPPEPKSKLSEHLSANFFPSDKKGYGNSYYDDYYGQGYGYDNYGYGYDRYGYNHGYGYGYDQYGSRRDPYYRDHGYGRGHHSGYSSGSVQSVLSNKGGVAPTNSVLSASPGEVFSSINSPRTNYNHTSEIGYRNDNYPENSLSGLRSHQHRRRLYEDREYEREQRMESQSYQHELYRRSYDYNLDDILAPGQAAVNMVPTLMSMAVAQKEGVHITPDQLPGTQVITSPTVTIPGNPANQMLLATGMLSPTEATNGIEYLPTTVSQGNTSIPSSKTSEKPVKITTTVMPETAIIFSSKEPNQPTVVMPGATQSVVIKTKDAEPVIVEPIAVRTDSIQPVIVEATYQPIIVQPPSGPPIVIEPEKTDSTDVPDTFLARNPIQPVVVQPSVEKATVVKPEKAKPRPGTQLATFSNLLDSFKQESAHINTRVASVNIGNQGVLNARASYAHMVADRWKWLMNIWQELDTVESIGGMQTAIAKRVESLDIAEQTWANILG